MDSILVTFETFHVPISLLKDSELANINAISLTLLTFQFSIFPLKFKHPEKVNDIFSTRLTSQFDKSPLKRSQAPKALLMEVKEDRFGASTAL